MSENDKSNYDNTQTRNAYHYVVNKNKERLIEELSKNQNNANARNDFEDSPLSAAIIEGEDYFINILLSYGAKFSSYDFTRTDYSVRTVSYAYALINHLESELKKRSSDESYNKLKDAIPSNALTYDVLDFLIRKNFINVATIILDKSTKMPAIGANKFSPLSMAMFYGHIEFAKLLLKNNFKFNSDDFDISINMSRKIEYAIKKEYHSSSSSEEYKTQIKNALSDIPFADDLLKEYPHIRDAYHHAANGDYTNLIQTLGKHHNNANARNSDEESPLSTAILNKKYSIVDTLLSYGAKFSQFDFYRKDGNSAKNLIQELEKSLHQYEDAFSGDLATNAVLYILAQNNAYKFASLILEKAEKIPATDGNNESPVSTAFHCNNPHIAKLYIQKGLKFSKFDFTRKDGNFAKDLITKVEKEYNQASSSYKYQIKNALSEVATYDVLYAFAQNNAINLASLALENAEKIPVTDDNHESPISTAFHCNNPDIAKLYIQKGLKFSKFDFTRKDGDFAKSLFTKVSEFCSSNKGFQNECKSAFDNFELAGEDCTLTYDGLCLTF